MGTPLLKGPNRGPGSLQGASSAAREHGNSVEVLTDQRVPRSGVDDKYHEGVDVVEHLGARRHDSLGLALKLGRSHLPPALCTSKLTDTARKVPCSTHMCVASSAEGIPSSSCAPAVT